MPRGSDTDHSQYRYAPGPPGAFVFPGAGDPVRPSRGDGFLTTAESAKLAGVSASTLRDWRSKGYLQAQGLDERGHPLHTAAAVREADRLAREAGLKASGIDPLRLRGRARAPFPAAA